MVTSSQIALVSPFVPVLVFTASGNAKSQTEVNLTLASGGVAYFGDSTVTISTGFPLTTPGQNPGAYGIKILLSGGDTLYAVTNTPTTVVALLATS